MILKQSKTTYDYVLERSEEQVSVRGIPNRIDVYVAGERLYSGVAGGWTDIPEKDFMQCGHHSWKKRRKRRNSKVCLERLFTGLFGI